MERVCGGLTMASQVLGAATAAAAVLQALSATGSAIGSVVGMAALQILVACAALWGAATWAAVKAEALRQDRFVSGLPHWRSSRGLSGAYVRVPEKTAGA